MDDYEKVATSLLIIFGALIIGGLMLVHIAIGNKPGFLFALSAGVFGWFSAFAVLFNKPKLYLSLIVLSVMAVAGSITFLVK